MAAKEKMKNEAIMLSVAAVVGVLLLVFAIVFFCVAEALRGSDER